MKRDSAVIRMVLEYIEEHDAVERAEIKVDAEPEVVKGHVDLCVQARLLSESKAEIPTVNLTWKGHDYLAKLKLSSP